MSKRVRIVEVGLRDGLQNESMILSVEQRLHILRSLVAAGCGDVEVGAFVSPKWVPQMAGSSELMLAARRLFKSRPDLKLSALVPNLRGFEDALKARSPRVAIFAACSESFSQKNINCSMKESLQRYREVTAAARKNKIPVRGYLSVVFGCPYEGQVPTSQVVKMTRALLEMGVDEISLGDTIGVATPRDVEKVLRKLQGLAPTRRIALHLHDTRGTALANTVEGLRHGIRIFDSSIGGLGGCPYAPGSLGNVATEDMVYLLEGMGFKTGLKLKSLVAINKDISGIMNRSLPSRVGALPLERFKN